MSSFFKDVLDGMSNVDRTSITEAVNDAYKTIDTLALYARQKSDELIDKLSKASPDEMCDFNKRNGIYMLRLMHLNEQENEITLNALGTDAVLNGDHTAITGSAISPSYAKNMNYKDNFAKNVSSYEKGGIEATQVAKDINGQPYKDVENLYPDEDNSGTFSNKWNTVNQNSALNKTKKLFNQHKINTIISRFHTDPTAPTNSLSVRTEYGESHGRNLLTKDAETKGGTYAQNGYDNPYCRVWTHHYQYDKLKKLIRPFKNGDESVVLSDFHKWSNFGDIPGETENEKWGWKNDNKGWAKSVLGNNGFVNITPKYNSDGAKKLHTKQCMFSIENLAWKDYDPYSFEKALAWEQRGPFGGRIMWFPPYGINFTETTSTNWANHTFIGRGEDVYTYVNTIRSGTLNFMMIVDHPSIIDYVSWWDPDDNKVKDTDLLRFFAGCDSGDSNDPNSLLYYAKPTPLTDEYINKIDQEHEAKEKEKPEPPTPPESPEEQEDITFYVFYPNDYSGVYDRVNAGETKVNKKGDTNVEAIPYLLYGIGAQMRHDSSTGLSTNLPIDFSGENSSNWGGGYEMSEKGLGEESGNYITGSSTMWQFNTSNTDVYKKSNRKWYYRIDGEYNVENTTSSNRYINCYDQRLTSEKNYVDSKSFKLNKEIEEVMSMFDGEGHTEENLFSLAEIASYFCEKNGKDKIKTQIACSQERIDKLKEKLEKEGCTIDSVEVWGFSNEHGSKSQWGQDRNAALSKNRAETVVNWLRNCCDWKVNYAGDIPAQELSDEAKRDVNARDAKKWRSAKAVIHFNTSKTESPEEPENNTPSLYGQIDINEIVEQIKQKLEEIRRNEKITGEMKTDDISSVIEKVLSNTDYYPDILNELKSQLPEALDVMGCWVDVTLDNKDAEGIFDDLPYFVSQSSTNEIKNIDDFKNGLGKLIEEKIRSIKEVKEIVKSENKDIQETTKKFNEYNTIQDKIDSTKQKIKDLQEKLEEKKNEYDEKLNEQSQLKTERGTLQNELNIEEGKDPKDEHRIEDYKKRIANLDKQISKYDNDILKKINDSIDKINENISKVQTEQSDLEKELNAKWDEYSEALKNVENANYEIKVNDIKDVIKKYIKGESDIDKEYYETIAVAIEKSFIDGKYITVRGIYDETNKTYGIDVIFNDGIVEAYNTIITNYSDILDKSLVVDKSKLKEDLKNTYYSFSCDDIDNIDERLEDYHWSVEWNDENVDALIDYIENTETHKTIENEIKKDDFINKLKGLARSNLYIYKVEVIDDKCSELQSEIDTKDKEKQEAYDRSEYQGFSKHMTEDGEVYYINENETDVSKMGQHWVYDEETQQFVIRKEVERGGIVVNENGEKEASGDVNKWRYGQEYHFFRVLEMENPIVFKNLKDKVKYFDPAFHSMTPEGFNERLTFLNQCMRQGNTVSVSDGGQNKDKTNSNGRTANNLAFGRPPFCVLRLGDFFYQKIVIDNISINYDVSNGLQWDLNTEGIGVQPLLANVSISFKFIGGADLGGPVQRLQNAMSFNYYANTSLYDNRSDRMVYNYNDKTNGALDSRLDINSSYFHNVATQKK